MRSPLHIFRFLTTKLPIGYESYITEQLTEFQKEAKSPLRILDLGAGPAGYWRSGKLANFLEQSGSELVLLDASSEFNSMALSDGARIKRVNGIVPDSLYELDENCFDVVIAIDLLEHLTKSDGYLMLYEIDRIGKLGQIIMMPNGFSWQPPASNNFYNAHLSAWKPLELKKIGFGRIRGQIGSKLSYGPYGLPKRDTQKWVVKEIQALDTIVFYLFPSLSFSFISTKRQKNPRIHNHT